MNITTPAFCSIYGMAGLLFCSPLNTQVFGAATLGIAGAHQAGMSSLGKVDLASSNKGVTMEAGTRWSSSPPSARWRSRARRLEIGQVLPDPGNTAQMVTTEVSVKGTTGLRVMLARG